MGSCQTVNGRPVTGGNGGDDVSAVIHFGSNAVGTADGSRYLWPGYDDTLAAPAPVQWRAPRPGTLRNMYVRHNIPTGPDAQERVIVYTFWVGDPAVATLLSVSLRRDFYDGNDLAHTVAVAQGALIFVEANKPVGIGVSPNDIICSVEFL